MSDDDILLDVTDGVATITLNQPERMNALSEGIKSGISDALDEINERDDVRCVVFEGAGNAFCAGGDISGMDDRNEAGADDYERTQGIIESCEAIPIRIFEYDLPTVAKIDGYCLGAGVGVAMACDVLLASDRAQFGLVFRNVGLTLDFATSLFVTRAVGPYVAKELALTGDVIDADRAAELGLVNRVHPVEEFDSAAQSLIDRIASGPTVALHQSTTNIDRSYGSSIREVVEREAKSQNIATSTRDHREGVDAFSEDREPSFEGR